MLSRRLVQGLVFAAVMIAPWWRGAVRPEAQLALATLAVAALIVRLSASGSRSLSRAPPWFAWFVVMGIPWGALQLIPCDPTLLARLSPQAAAWYAEVAHEPPATATLEASTPSESANARQPLSLAPVLTRDQLVKLLVAAAFLLLTLEYFRSAAEKTALLAIIASNGTLLAFVALAQKLTGRGLLWWEPHSTWFGPFVNRNNGAGYAGMCLVAVVAIAALHWRRNSRDATAPLHTLGIGWRRIDGVLVASVFAVVCICAAVAVSLSRGAVVSLVAGALATAAALLVLRKSWTAMLLTLTVAVGVGGVVFWLGRFNAVEDRLDTLSDATSLKEDGRVLNWSFATDAAKHFPLTGSGLGTYRFAYPAFQTLATRERFHSPENVFLQTWVEAGVPGLLLITAGFLAALVAAWRLLAGRSGDSAVPLGACGLLLLLTQAVHGCLDNGFHLPANTLLLACMCGILLSAPLVGSPATNSRNIPNGGYGTQICYVLLLPLICWGIVDRYSAVRTYYALESTKSATESVAVDEVVAAIAEIEPALRDRPDDYSVQLRASELHQRLYQLRTVEELRAAGEPEERLDFLASPRALYAAAVHFERVGDEEGLRSLRRQPAVERYLVPARNYALAAWGAAPADADAPSHLCRLDFLVRSPRESERLFDLAAARRPADPALLFRLGIDQLEAGELEPAAKYFRVCWTLDAKYQAAVTSMTERRFSYDDFLAKVVPPSEELLLRLRNDLPLYEHQRRAALEKRLERLGFALPR